MARSDLMVAAEFDALVGGVAPLLRDSGRTILRGAAAVAPYRHGSVTACDRCDLQDVCRVDPESVRYRRLPSKAGASASAGPE